MRLTKNNNNKWYLLFFSLLAIGYSMLWYHSWYLPLNFAVIDNTASWFLPAGYRMAAFLFAPRKYWMAIIIGEWTAIRLITIERGEIDLVSELIATTIPAIVYLGCAHLYLRNYKTPSLKTTERSIALLVTCVAAATLTSAILNTSMIYHGELSTITENELFTHKHLQMVMAFAFGDVIGVLLILPSILLVTDFVETYQHRQTQIAYTHFLPLLWIIMVTIAITLAIQSIPLIYIKLLCVTLVIAGTHKFGWHGAVISILIMCIVIVYTSLISTESVSVIENQVYLITIAFTSLILGASITEQSVLNQKLKQQNTQLNQLNQVHQKDALKNQLLAARVVEIQELERKKIATELHDDIGQVLTALRTEVSILKRASSDQNVHRCAEYLRTLCDKIYNATRNLITLLHPRELDDLGLEKALKSKLLTQLLRNANINYQLHIKHALSNLSDDTKIAIYRIVQESFNNIVKHASARNVTVEIAIENDLISLSIQDDGVGFDVNKASIKHNQFGLITMEERALALKGNFQLHSSSEGTQIEIKLPIK
ncbi:MASE1 domain-containing protein [Pseudoalteromonas spongiae]|uniref:MASE1 domain-containing protein n=1 Tax=Pseudoalteromonas spongiae TaxID=298657 RepID=UPI0037366753